MTDNERLDENRLKDVNGGNDQSWPHVLYQIKAGDTMTSIAARFSLPVEELCGYTGFGVNDQLPVGGYIHVPAPDWLVNNDLG